MTEPGSREWMRAYDRYLSELQHPSECPECECHDPEYPGENINDDNTGYETCDCECHPKESKNA